MGQAKARLPTEIFCPPPSRDWRERDLLFAIKLPHDRAAFDVQESKQFTLLKPLSFRSSRRNKKKKISQAQNNVH